MFKVRAGLQFADDGLCQDPPGINIRWIMARAKTRRQPLSRPIGIIPSHLTDDCKLQNKVETRAQILNPVRSHPKAHPMHNAGQISSAPVLEDSENTRPPQGSEHNAHWCQFSRPNLLVSISAALVARRCFSRTVSGADSFLVCAQASSNAVEKT